MAVLPGAFAAELKHPDWHPSGRYLLAEGDCAGDIDLYLIDTETVGITLLLDTPGTTGYPRWGPKDDEFYYHEIDRPNRVARLWQARLDGGQRLRDRRPLTEGPFDIEPAPSPDGRYLAFSRDRGGGLDITIIDLLHPERIHSLERPGHQHFPSWRSDGRALLYTEAAAPVSDLSQLDIEHGSPGETRTLIRRAAFGDWAPTGGALVYTAEVGGDRELFLATADLELTLRITERDGRDEYPKFSSDGRFLAYHRVIAEEQTEIALLELASGAVRSYRCAGLAGAED